jgi:hypothetical protein
MAFTSRAVCLLLLCLALCQAVTALELQAEPRPVERIQKALAEITTLSDNLRVETQKITLFNAGQQGIVITQGFATIIVKITEYTARIAGTAYGYNPTPFPDADAKLVVQSLTTFVEVHQALLNVVIGKHGLATMFPFFEPIRISLVNLEIVVDTFAFYLIDLIPTQKPAATEELGKLSITLKDAQNTYSLSLVTSGMVMEDKPLVQTIQEAFKEITGLSDTLRQETAQITIFNAPQQGFKIALGFSGIITKIAETSAKLAPGGESLGKLSPLGDDDAKLVVQSLTTFVHVHQALLNVVIGKHGLLTMIPFFEPIRLALVQLEVVVDTFAFYLIDLIPTQKPAADAQIASLSVTIDDAKNVYSTPVAEVAVAHQMNMEAGKPQLQLAAH